MKIKTLLRSLNHVLESEEASQGRERHGALKKILKKLKSKRKRLEARLASAPAADRPKIVKKLKTVNTHREKALNALRRMAGK